jgi:hypothetical protein
MPTGKAITRGSRTGTPGHGVVMAAASKAATADKTAGAGASRAGMTGRPPVAGSARRGAAGTRTASGAAVAAVTRGMAGRLAAGMAPAGMARAVPTIGVARTPVGPGTETSYGVALAG